jgi:hypothetical protein
MSQSSEFNYDPFHNYSIETCSSPNNHLHVNKLPHSLPQKLLECSSNRKSSTWQNYAINFYVESAAMGRKESFQFSFKNSASDKTKNIFSLLSPFYFLLLYNHEHVSIAVWWAFISLKLCYSLLHEERKKKEKISRELRWLGNEIKRRKKTSRASGKKSFKSFLCCENKKWK